MKYDLDLSRVSLGAYKEQLKKQNLLPGRRLLLSDIEENFTRLQNCGIKTVLELRKSLSSAQKIAAFSAESDVSEEYLAVLNREAGCLVQKTLPLESFPGIDADLVSTLRESGIRTSKAYFESGLTLSEELFCLCDLVRINGVGAAAAKAFYEAGYKSVSDVAAADAETMLGRVSEANHSGQYYKAKLGVKDMQFCIDFAVLLLKYCA
jgi:hypothetical protein